MAMFRGGGQIKFAREVKHLKAFELRLVHTAELVSGFLERALDDEARRGTPDRLLAAMRHAVLGGGKRLRPFLTVECARLFDVPETTAIVTGGAIELIHCYSLVHDDLPAMDNDELRRGAPTVWKAFDDWTAILAGDAIQTLAFEVLSRPECHDDPAVRCVLVSLIASAAGASGMAGGQALDLEAGKLTPQISPDIEQVRRLQSMKTGRLLRASCEAGAVLGRGTPDQRKAVKQFGDFLGFAFQIQDDLLDAEGKAATVGKATGKDAEAGKATLVSLIGVEEARRHLDQMISDAVSALTPFGSRADVLAEAARYVGRRSH